MQSGLRRLIIRNLSLQTIAEAVAVACGLGASMLLSRHLGVEGFGAFNYAFAFIYLFLSLNDLGVNTIVIREVSQTPERAGEIIGAALSLRAAVASVVFAVALVAIWLWPMDPALRAPLSLFALILPLNALNVPALLFTTTMRFGMAAVATIVLRVSGLLLIGLVVALGLGVTAVLAALLVAEVIGLAFVYSRARTLAPFRMHVDRAAWRTLTRAAAPIGASLLLTAVVNRIDFVMLEHMASLEAVGLYSAAYRVTAMFEKLPLLVMATLYPVMSRLATSDRARLREVYRRAVAHFAVIAIPAGAVVTFLAPWLVALVFGAEYRAAGGALRYLIWSTVCVYLALAGGNLLISVGRARDNLLALSIGAIVNVGLNLVLIPRFGITGAAFATAVSFVLILLVTMAAVERVFRAPAPVAV